MIKNSATMDLENDHVNILRLTGVMEKITKASEPEITDLETVVYLIQNYADGFHHAKEEKILFPFLSKKGFSQQQGPVAVMLADHVRGRNYTKGMAAGIALCKQGDPSALEQVFLNMTGYINLLRNHIAKENNILFRMADQVLTVENHAGLLKEYSGVIPLTQKGGGLIEYLDDIERLDKKYH
ncbi:MAG TPA: hemerythrin domain-containing protein [Bacteroidales bacterium]|nr:hemerythrin domain-containing protein [Bacteroidales bacterium]